MKIIALLCLLSALVPGQSPSTGTAETKGACSPANTGNKNTFNIKCGIGKEQGDQILRILNKILADHLDPNAVMTMLESIQSQVSTKGVLEPDSRPDPEFDWLGHQLTPQPDALNVFFGSNLASFTGQKCTIFRIAGNDVLWVERSPNGILISAKVFDPDKKIMAEIEKNKVTVNPNNTFKRDIKKHTLVVVDESDREVLNVDFVNPHSVVINGIFPWDDYGPVIADKTILRLARRGTMSQSFTNCGTGVAFVLDSSGALSF